MRDDLNPSSPFYVFQFHSFLKVTFPLPIALDRDLQWVKKGREKKKKQQQQKPLRAKKSAKNRGRFLDGCGLPCIHHSGHGLGGLLQAHKRTDSGFDRGTKGCLPF